MKTVKNLTLSFLVYVFLASCSMAEDRGIVVPDDNKQRLIIDNINLSASDFFDAYMSRDVAKRRLAEMYLAGTLDVTEGQAWCGYGLALPGSIQEQIYIGFKNKSEKALKARASTVITAIMIEILPCKENH
ncbi:Rap1a/Tai family immunity protein [Thalassomonas sp. RHCl1]|uniref:Rap1a/Tai family immunity protein n=1 Tax=Thalassomonas sp. RHCl1 TaxID=2995320 RepID=UPI00248D296C|nr:Rap1a/Tai family immunity protein [Thalassomonas sp. RHCl1]